MKFPFRDPGRIIRPGPAGRPARAWPETKGGVMRAAALAACGLPAAVLFFSMAGYGAMCREFGLPFEIVIASTPLIWGLPGQIAMAEMIASGAPVIAVALAVAAANARFMPMVMALMPLLRDEKTDVPPWRNYLLAQMVSLNSWTAAMRDCPSIARPLRRSYFWAFSAVCMSAGTAGAAAGYFATGVLPRPVALGLVFLNPAFFALVFANVRTRAGALALVFGASLGPALHLVSSEWGLPLAGVIAGTAAFGVDEGLRRRAEHRAGGFGPSGKKTVGEKTGGEKTGGEKTGGEKTGAGDGG